MLTTAGIVLAVGSALIGLAVGCAMGSSGRAGAEEKAWRAYQAVAKVREMLRARPDVGKALASVEASLREME